MSVKFHSKNRSDGNWTLREAGMRFSEVARRARSEGPQTVELPDGDVVVVTGAKDQTTRGQEQTRQEKDQRDIVAFFESLYLPDFVRDEDDGERQVEL